MSITVCHRQLQRCGINGYAVSINSYASINNPSQPISILTGYRRVSHKRTYNDSILLSRGRYVVL